ncbi:TPA: RNA-guided endonuclease IscB, partial [Escherichia coli]
MEWSKRFMRLSPVGFITVESVKFDMQKMENAAVEGLEYQRGTLFDYEVKEYLLEKYHYSCVYCGAKNVPFEKEHVIPRSRGGSNRISNLVLSCHDCNQKKDNLIIEEFLKDNPALLKKIKAQLKSSLKDAAAVNITRKQIVKELINLNVPVLTGTGAETKYNRVSQKYPKEHYIDALCAGTTGAKIYIPKKLKPLLI